MAATSLAIHVPGIEPGKVAVTIRFLGTDNSSKRTSFRAAVDSITLFDVARIGKGISKEKPADH